MTKHINTKTSTFTQCCVSFWNKLYIWRKIFARNFFYWLRVSISPSDNDPARVNRQLLIHSIGYSASKNVTLYPKNKCSYTCKRTSDYVLLRTDSPIDRQTDWQTERKKDSHTDGETEKQTDRLTDRKTHGQTDR